MNSAAGRRAILDVALAGRAVDDENLDLLGGIIAFGIEPG